MTQSIKLLVVDDEANVVKLCRMILGKAGYTVVGASSGNEALELVESAKPDVVILDVMMPGLGGIELCRLIRKKHGNNTPLVMMYTADTSISTRQRSLDAGANVVVTKETPIFELPAKIASFLE